MSSRLDQFFTSARICEASARPVELIVRLHVDDASVICTNRMNLVAAAGVGLLHLERFDDRLNAHLDALSVSGEKAWPFCEQALEVPGAGVVFVAGVRAIEDRRQDRLDRLLTLAQADPEAFRGLMCAFGWVDATALRGIVAGLLTSPDPFRKLVGIASSAMHRVDPGLIAARLFEHSDAIVRARAFRTAGELGMHKLVSTLAAAIADQDENCRFWAAWSAVLLGDRQAALESLVSIAMEDCPQRSRAFQLVLQALPANAAHEQLRRLAVDPKNLGWLVRGTGLAGDPTYVPWLIGHMVDDKVARLAGESFSTITGLDLALLDLERKPPENLETGPNDDPEDSDVAMDADDGLPWPDQGQIQAWWSVNGARFTAGTRYFMGATVARGRCIDVLKNGYQRQRITAAYHLCLSHPGTQLFEWRAPAWRQRQELARLA